MAVEKISFLNIRKTSEAHYKFIPQTNIIIGQNGVGKTTIIETLFLLSTSKSFRKKQNRALLKEGKKHIQAKGSFINKTEKKTIKILIEKNKKTITKNKEKIKKTSDLLSENPMVCMSPEEVDIIEAYKGEKIKYFDKIIFKTNKNYIENIKTYNKFLLYRNLLLEQQKPTEVWDEQISKEGIIVWKERKRNIKELIKTFKKVQKKIGAEEYEIEYISSEIEEKQKYIEKLQKKENREKTKTGPHADTFVFRKNKKNLQEHGSQGEKKLFKHILKLAEAEFLKKQNKTVPILLLDDFFDKLDSKNIMKIFVYFHCKFQTIITTTETNEDIIKKTLGVEEKQIKIIKCQ